MLNIVTSIRFKFYLFLLLVCENSGKYVRINSKPNGVVFKYTKGINGEKGLHECVENEACNVVHDRFWMPPLAERLCRCPNGHECPWQWNRRTKNGLIKVNNRSVFEHCTSLSNKKPCKHKQPAVIVHGKGDVNNTYMIPHKVLTKCDCPYTHYWRLQKFVFTDDNLYQVFRCVKQGMCDSFDFCGFIRADLYSTYYRCTCPTGHLCIFENRTLENVQELLYSGPAYRAYCIPFQP